MKEKDLKKNLENLIIDGLIKEAEQDNADFEAAMKQMSEEEFEELIYEPAYAYADENRVSEVAAASIAADMDMTERHSVPSQPFAAKKSKWQVFRPWITSAVAAAAIVLIVLIPSVNSMNNKLCESALYASQSYITPSKGGFDISSASTDEIKEQLPILKTRYENCLDEIQRSKAHLSADLQEAGWDLTVAYLKLHKKSDAVKVLKVLVEHYKGSPFGDHCKMMLDQL